MEENKNSYLKSTQSSDEESDGGYNPAAFNTNNTNNEYHIEPRLSPNTPAYYPTKSMLSHPDDDSDSQSSVEHNNHSKDHESSRRIRYESEDEDDEVATASSAKKVMASDEEEEQTSKSHNSVVEKLGLLDDSSDDEEKAGGEDDKNVADFEGFDGDEPGTKDKIADIFGESDNEGDGDFEGFAENEVEKEVASNLNDDELIAQQAHKRRHQQEADSDDSEDGGKSPVASIFDQVMQRIKSDRRRRRRKDVEFLNDMDDIIRDTINRMRDAAEQDRILLADNKPGVKKIGMLKEVDELLLKADIAQALIDNGILTAIAEWLSPVSGRTLPAIAIRECLLKHLHELRIEDTELLKESGIGKAVMFIYKHPLETSANKKLAHRLINAWSRPIFNLQIDYRSISREDRKEMDMRNVKRPRVTEAELELVDKEEESSRPLKPGDEGFINRARVPQPSNKTYLVRPKWKVPDASGRYGDDEDEDRDEDGEERPSTSTSTPQRQRRGPSSIASSLASGNRLERHIKAISRTAAVKKKQRFARAVKMSIEGRNMSM